MPWSLQGPQYPAPAGATLSERLPAMRHLTDRMLRRARQTFYNIGGPWYRCRLFELFGSQRFSRPAMFGMDVRLAELMPWRGGVFVEAGAHDGYTQSNTYYLERARGWSGLLIEPIPELRERCARRRRDSQVMGVALVHPDASQGTVTMRFGDLTSSMGDHEHASRGLLVAGRRGYSVQVPAHTLSETLDRANLDTIDVMVLDLEGLEADALAGLDLERHSPRYIVVEMLDRVTQQPAIDGLLERGYKPPQALSDFDLLYERKDSSGATT